MTESELQTGRRELERVLASPGVVRNDRLARFLRFVVEKHLEGRDDEVKESVLAVEVFGHSPERPIYSGLAAGRGRPKTIRGCV